MAVSKGAARTPEERLYRIVEDGLCIGCGLCQSVAGAERLSMVVTPEGNERPYATVPLDHATVDRIYDVCPGTRIDGLPEAEVVEETTVDPVWGPTLRIVRAYAADPEVRFKGSTGGVLTALGAYLVESGRVDFVLHAKASESQPTFGERHMSFTRADVLHGMGSRYGPTAPLVDLGDVLDRARPFAYIGKPCDVSALRNYARHDPRVDALCRYKLALVCGGFMPTPDMRAFLKGIGIDYHDIVDFRYRGYGCPGATRVETRDGRVVEKDYLDFWGEDASAWSLPFRCKVCPDGIGEAADLAASDTWPGGSPTWEGQAEDPGTNAVLARTRAGLELMEAAERDGALVIERDVTARDMDDYQPHQVDKKRAVWARHLGLRTVGKLAPEVRRLRIAELARENGVPENLRQARGTRRRVREGRTSEPTPRPE
jgi:coenzyme F420 hydrogenase subunit beta